LVPTGAVNNFSVNSSPDPKRKAELDRKLAKHSSIVNPILVGTFLGTKTLLVQPHSNNNIPAEVTALSFGVFLSALVGFNLLLYWHYKKQLTTKGEQII